MEDVHYRILKEKNQKQMWYDINTPTAKNSYMLKNQKAAGK